MSENQFTVSTPGGDIVAKSVGGPDYPDVSIYLGEQCVACLEWNFDTKTFDFHYYGMSDEPEFSVENVTELDDSDDLDD